MLHFEFYGFFTNTELNRTSLESAGRRSKTNKCTCSEGLRGARCGGARAECSFSRRRIRIFCPSQIVKSLAATAILKEVHFSKQT